MRVTRSVLARFVEGIVVGLGFAYLLSLHVFVLRHGIEGARDRVHSTALAAFAWIDATIVPRRCPLHGWIFLREGAARPMQVPSSISLIYRQPDVEYCSFYLNHFPPLDALPYPGYFFPDTLRIEVSKPPVDVLICEECQHIAFMTEETNYGYFRRGDSLWQLPRINLLAPPPAPEHDPGTGRRST